MLIIDDPLKVEEATTEKQREVIREWYTEQQMAKEHRIPVMEIFGPTIQGEGLMTGTVTHFLRTGGCGLRCSWCDSMYAVDPKQIRAGRSMMTTSEILEGVRALGDAPYLTLTGGDPCLHKDLGDIIHPLNIVDGMRVAVETQGELFPEWLAKVDVVTFSPKPPSSGNEVDYHAISTWIYDTWGIQKRPQRICIKIVVFDGADLEYALRAYKHIHPSLYDAFYFTAGTPITQGLPPPETKEQAEARGINKILGIVSGQRLLADGLLAHAGVANFNEKVHVGCQQHALIWPEYDRGR